MIPRMMRCRPGPLSGFLALTLLLGAGGWDGAVAQSGSGVAFETDLPRTLVFIAEEGTGQVASGDFAEFFRAAGFPLVDPALAHTAAQRELVQRALDGDEGAATELGRDFGAQVLVIGRADWGARPDPVQQAAMTATSEVSVRALRLDRGEVIATAQADGRRLEATEQAARTAAIRDATTEILQRTSFVGQLMNDWSDREWDDTSYWRPDPGSVPGEVDQAQARSAPALAILRAEVQPSEQGTTRGLGVVQRGDRSADVFNPVRLEGVVVGPVEEVEVDGQTALLEALAPDEADRLGINSQQAQRFWAELSLPMSRDTVRVVARGPGGATAEAVAAPRVNRRWAVVIGVSDYRDTQIPDLEYASVDAEAIYEFLTSPAAGSFEPENILLLTNEQATGAAMREALFVFLQQAAWDDLVLIYFAGHGAPDPSRPDNLYLLPYDADLNSMAATGFPMWDVKTALRRQIAAERVIVIADACHSAGTQDGEIWGVDGANPIANGFSELFTPSRRLTLTAADTNEFSFEDARWEGHGVFTHYLLQGLRGGADLNGDGIVTFTEAFDYVSRHVSEATNGRQNPQRAGLGDIPIAVVLDEVGSSR
jgi:hypothetical protein